MVCLLVFLLASIAGVGFGVVFFIPHAMFPDVIETDELETGERREGQFFSFFIFFQKVGLAVSLALSNYLLAASGFKSSDEENPVVVQPDSAIIVLKLIVSFIPVFVFVLSYIPLYFYPITKSSHKETVRALQEIRNKKYSDTSSSDSNSRKYADLNIENI